MCDSVAAEVYRVCMITLGDGDLCVSMAADANQSCLYVCVGPS
jgi:hypothetical protein